MHASEIDDDVERSEWDDFCSTVPGDTLPQTYSWASAKSSDEQISVIGIRESGDLVAGCMLVQRRLGPINIAYAPRGPILRSGSDHHAACLIQAIDRIARRRQPAVTVLQPVIESTHLARVLAASGFTEAPVDVATPATVQIDLTDPSDQLFARLRSSRRRNIRKAEQAGVTVRRGDRTTLATFHELHEHTARRQGFDAMSLSYLEGQWNALGGRGMLNVYLAELDGRALSAATVTTFGDRAVFKLAGLADDPEASKLRASDLLHWHVMLDAQERGLRWYDLGGFDKEAAREIAAGGDVPQEIRSSASQFKLGFGGEVVVLPSSKWRVSPIPTSRAQEAVTAVVRRSPRAHRLLMRFRD